MRADRYDAAKELAALAARAAAKTRDKELVGEVADRKKRVARLAQACRDVSSALETGKEVHSFDIRHGGTTVFVVAFSSDGRWALSGGFEPTARLWNVATGKAAGFDAHAHVYGGALSPDGRLGLTSGGDQLVRLWDMATRKELARYTGHAAHVYRVVLSPDGRRILSGDAQGVVRLWDTKTAKELHRSLGHAKPVSRVAFSPDGRYGLSSAKDDTVRLLGLPE